MWWYDISMKINEATFQGHPICLYLHYIDLLLGNILENIYSLDMFAPSGSLADQSFWAQVDLVHLILIHIWHMLAPTTKKERAVQILHIILICLDVSYTYICHLKHNDCWSIPSWSSNRFRELVISEAWLLVLKRRLVDYTAGRPMGWQMTGVWTKMQPFPIQIWKSTGKGALKERDRERLQENLEKRYSELIYFRDCIPAVTQRLPLAVPNLAKVLRKRWLSWQCSKKVLAATWMHSSPPECSFYIGCIRAAFLLCKACSLNNLVFA